MSESKNESKAKKNQSSDKAIKVELIAVKFDKTMHFNGKIYRKDETAGFEKDVVDLIEKQKFGKRVKS